jgi:GGDEF domain-containing protein
MQVGFFYRIVTIARQVQGVVTACACTLAACMALLVCTQAGAAPPLLNTPEIAQLSQSSGHVSLDVRKLWQSAVIEASPLPDAKANDPEQLWNKPDIEFATAKDIDHRRNLKAGQRLVSRLNLSFASFGPSMNLTFKMPRLDAVHLSYRYNQEPWTTVSSGDTLPMASWSFSDRQPTFSIPLRPGNLNLVAEVAHRGIFDIPVTLESASVFHDERTSNSLKIGLMIGLNLLMAVVGVAAAFSFARLGFLSISVMTLMAVAMIATNSGVAGVYLFTDSPTFNDEVKYATAILWCALFPWVTAVALPQRYEAAWWWRIAAVWAGIGAFMAITLKSNATRADNLWIIPIVATCSIALALAILVHALLRRQPHAMACVPPVLLYAVSLFIPIGGYMGIVANENTLSAPALLTVVSAMLFLQVLVRQYRQGRTVMSRAKSSPSRDVLTGLLSRKGFEQMLERNVQRMKSEQTYAAFFYIKVSDPDKLTERFGQEGFEGGMVQLAAAISSSISVVDTVGRVAPNAFAIVVLMPRDAGLANRLSQKILTRMISLASHGAPLAQTARIAVAWMPVFGIVLPDLERRAVRALRKIEEGKRITWVGGAMAQADASQLQDGLTNPTTKPHGGQEADELPSLPGVINRLEREMLGPDTRTLQDEADSLMVAMKSKSGELASIAGELRR